MSAPFVNPYETKDVVATTLNNLDKQTQDLISYLDGFFSSEVTKDRELVLDSGVVEVLKPFDVATSSGAFWDKGTTYYFQPIAERLREISQELQARLVSTDVSQNLRDGINQLFTQTLNSSRTQVVNGGNNQYANNWQYELWYNSTNANDPVNRYDTAGEINDFFKALGTSAFFLADAASDENAATQPMSGSASGLKIDVKLEGIADLLDDGDNYYNDSPVTDYLGTGQGVHSVTRQEEFYLIGNSRVPVFGKFETKPVLPNAPTAAQIEQYNREYYDFINQRIDPKSIYWNDPVVPKTNEEIFLGMAAIILTGQKRVEPVIPPNAANPTDTANAIRAANELMMNNALNALEQQAYDYLTSSKAWYDSAPPRNTNSAISPAPPSFLLSKMNAPGTIDYSDYDGNYGTFDPSSTDNLTTLIATGTGLSAAQVTDTLNNWNNAAYQANVNKITAYYTQSYLSASIVSTFPQDDSSLATKNLFLHNTFSKKEPSENPYLTSDKVLKFDQVLNDTPAGYFRSPENTAVTGVSTQMMQIMDMFLENFDISSARYVEDKRTLVDLFTGKLVNAAGDNEELSKLLFQNISDAADDIAAQSKNILTRGIADAVENQFMLDLFNQTAVRKEDYGLSPNPADATKNFLPTYWAEKKDKFFPAHYYFDPVAGYTPTDVDKANHHFDPTKNGLPAGFPIMDLRDFNEFFKAIKNELNNLLGSGYITGYPTWSDTGFTGTVADVFGSMSNETDLARAIQLRDSVTTILDNLEDRVGKVSGDIPKIPRPQTVTVDKPTGVDALGNIVTTPEIITLNSSIAGYGDQASLKLVTHFLQMHRDTSGIEDANRPAANKINDQINYLINMFDDYSKFSQNSAFETVYPGQVFEADKQNYTILNAKKPEPGPDGSMPEEKDVPKPLMSARSSSLVIGQIGQVITTKVNDIVQENNAVYVENIKRAGGTNLATGLADNNIGAIDIANTQLGGSAETQIYLNNIFKQIASISATGTLSVDISAIGSQISTQVEAGVKSLITDTDNNNYRMVFIDDKTIDDLNNLLTVLNSFSPTGALATLKNDLNNASLSALKSLAYPTGSSAPGYLHYNALTAPQRTLIERIRDGSLTTASIQALIPSNTVPVQIPDATLNTLQTLADNIETALNAALVENPPRDVNLATDPVLAAIKAAKIDFNSLTASDSGNEVDYNVILDAAVFDPVAVPLAPHTAALVGHPNETAIRNARTNLLAGLLTNANKNIGGVLLTTLNTGNAANPYRHLFSPVSYTDINPANATPAFPNSLSGIANAGSFRDQLANIETYLADLDTALNAAINEKPPRDIDVNNDPILKLAQLADLDLGELRKTTNDLWNNPYNAALTPAQVDDRLTAIRESDKAAGGPLGASPVDDDIRAARNQLLRFFLNNENIIDPDEGNFRLAQVNGTNTGHVRYRNLIAPVTHTYPNTNSLDDTNANTTPLTFTANIDPSKADSYTLREILGADVNMNDGVQTGNVTNSLEDLETRMRANPGTEFTANNRRLYVRKMQHFNILFNTLSGGTNTNQPLKSFLEKVPPGTTISGDTYNHPRLRFASLGTPSKTLGEYIESIASDPAITGSAAFTTIVNQVQTLAPIIDNINALDVTLASDIKKPKAGPESNVYSTLHLLTQIENQRDDKDMALGLIQIFNTRKIKVEGTGIEDLKQRDVTAINLKEGEYQFHGYAANINFLKPANVPTISGAGVPPDPNQRWNLEQAILNKGASLPPFTDLADTREFLVAANEVYKDMKSSKSKVIREQVLEFDLWLKNNSISRIADGALTGKEALEADVNLIDHILLGAANGDATLINTVSNAEIKAFMDLSKTEAIANRTDLESLNALRVGTKGLSQRLDDGFNAQELRKYFRENLYYPANASFAAIPGDTRADFTKDHFGRDLNNSNLPVLGVNIFGADHPMSPALQAVNGGAQWPDPAFSTNPAPSAAIPSDSHKNFSLNPTSTVEPYQQMFDNVEAILAKLETAEAAGYASRKNEISMYKAMLQNLLGESAAALTTNLVNAALAENATALVPSDPSLSGGGLTYTNNYPSANLKSNILAVRDDIAGEIDPQKFTGTPAGADLAKFTLAKVANTPTSIRDIGVEGRSIQELVVLMYVLQMFEQSNWDWEKYINDTSRYEVESAV